MLFSLIISVSIYILANNEAISPIKKGIKLELYKYKFSKTSNEQLNNIYTDYLKVFEVLYTTMSVGTPKQNGIKFFFNYDETTLSFEKEQNISKLIYGYNHYVKKLIYTVGANCLYKPFNSKTHIAATGTNISDIFEITTIEDTKMDLRFNYSLLYEIINTTHSLCGHIGLDLIKQTFIDLNQNFYTQLKEYDLIENYWISFVANKDDSDKFGVLYVGKELHDLFPDKFNIEELITLNIQKGKINYAIKNYILLNIYKFLYYKDNKNIEENAMTLNKNVDAIIDLKVKYFITDLQNLNIFEDKILNHYIAKNICKKEQIKISDRIYYKFNCDEQKLNSEKSNFPVLHFNIALQEFELLLNYEDLFGKVNEEFSFLILFTDEANIYGYRWVFGLHLLKKYTFSFNFKENIFALYFNEIKNVNAQILKYKENNNNNNNNSALKTVINIFIIIILLVIAFFIGLKFRQERKRRANELKDLNYTYIPEPKQNSELKSK